MAANGPNPSSTPARAVLDGMRRIGFYNGEGNPEDYMLPSVMRECMEYLGDAAGLKGGPISRW